MYGSDRVLATVGTLTAVGAVTVDLVLWQRYPLYFGPGILLGVGAPLALAAVGVAAGVVAAERTAPRLGVGLVVLNLLGAVLGVVWVWGTRASIPG